MATIEPYQTKGGRRYRVRFRTPDRRQTDKRGFKTKRDAQAWAAQNTVDLNAGAWRPERAGKITVTEAANQWLETKRSIAPKTHSGYRYAIKHIATTGGLGTTYLKDVTSGVVERWVVDMAVQHKPKGVHNSFGVLNQIMSKAVKDKRIAVNPCTGVELPRVERNTVNVVPMDKLSRLIDAAGEHAPVVAFLAFTGLRWGEMAGLQVGDVDLERRRIHVRRQITEDSGRLIRSLPKHHTTRTVPVVGQVADILEPRITGRSADELVFTTASGAVLRNRNARRDWFDASATAAGLEGLTPHELRHTFASVAIRAGASIKALQSALGHSSAAITLNIYGHMFPDDYDAFTTRMTDVFAADCGQNVGKEARRTLAPHDN